MKDSQLKHFCTHALTDIVDQFNDMGGQTRRGKMVHDEPWWIYTRALVKWLRQSQKFAMLESEAMTVPGDICREWITGEPRLPFQFTAIEIDTQPAPHLEEKELVGLVLVCAELQAIERPIFEAIQKDIDFADDTEGFLFWPIMKSRYANFNIRTHPTWTASPVMAVVMPSDEMGGWVATADRRQKHYSAGKDDEPFLFVQHMIDEQMITDDFVTQYEDQSGRPWTDVTGRDMVAMFKDLTNAMGELMVKEVGYIAALNVLLNTKNVQYRTHPAVAKLNHKRKKRGAELFYEYKTLHLYPDDVTYVGETLGPHQHRRGPKLHMRRGHVRRLRTGGTTFVRQAIIGKKKRGLVMKDYQIEPKGRTS